MWRCSLFRRHPHQQGFGYDDALDTFGTPWVELWEPCSRAFAMADVNANLLTNLKNVVGKTPLDGATEGGLTIVLSVAATIAYRLFIQGDLRIARASEEVERQGLISPER
ncbi:MAG: hypothetical protein U1F57_05820 [bacterium]